MRTNTAPEFLIPGINAIEFFVINDELFYITNGIQKKVNSYSDIPKNVSEKIEEILIKNNQMFEGLILLAGNNIDNIIFQFIKCRLSGNDHYSDIINGELTEEFIECSKRGSCIAEKSVCRFHGLTPKEIEVIKLIAAGFADKQIADQLGMSEQTIPVHRKHIHYKLKTESKPQITAFALKHNIV